IAHYQYSATRCARTLNALELAMPDGARLRNTAGHCAVENGNPPGTPRYSAFTAPFPAAASHGPFWFFHRHPFFRLLERFHVRAGAHATGRCRLNAVAIGQFIHCTGGFLFRGLAAEHPCRGPHRTAPHAIARLRHGSSGSAYSALGIATGLARPQSAVADDTLSVHRYRPGIYCRRLLPHRYVADSGRPGWIRQRHAVNNTTVIYGFWASAARCGVFTIAAAGS